MATYLITEPAFINGIYYLAGTTLTLDDDYPSAMNWIPQDDAAKRNVDVQNQKRKERGLVLDKLPSVAELISKLEDIGYSVKKEGGIEIDPEGTGGSEALRADGVTGTVKREKVIRS
jgi:hypothetical protein